jgi:oligosaccharyl transferase (archaeosortase A-associated)
MDTKAFPRWLPALLVLTFACLLSWYLRVVLPYDSVFDGQWIKMTTNDAYFYMRMVDNLLPNFAHLNSFDPYFLFPGGFSTEGFPYLFAYLLAGTVRLLGGAAPSQQVADTIAVYIPPIIATLTIIPVYFIGRTLMNGWAGSVAAVLVAVMPGELLTLSVLGNTDHHVAEIFLTSCFSLFLILAVKNERQFAYSMIVNRQWNAAARHIHYSVIAGVFMGLYLATWKGALFFVFLVFVYAVIQFISDHLRGLSTDYLSRAFSTCFLVCLLTFLTISRINITLLALVFMIAAPLALNMLSGFMRSRRVKSVYFPIVIAVVGLLGLVAVWILLPELFKTVALDFREIFSWRMQQNVVGEMKPLFFPVGEFTFDVAWSQFGLVLFSGLAGLVVLVYFCIRDGKPEQVFVVSWTLVMMMAVLAMVRSATYFSICLAVLTGWLAGYAMQAFLSPKAQEPQKKSGKKARRMMPAGKRPLRLILAPIIVGCVVMAILAPAMIEAVTISRSPFFTPSDAWVEALEWMKKNTPEPFGDADYYYRLYDPPATGKAYAYPDTVYGVVTWSDYGYWVTRIGHRIPTSNPATYPREEARFFTAENETAVADYLQKWRAKYVIIDGRISSPNDKFYAIANLSGRKESDFYELCWQKKDDKYTPLLVFYPDFYRSMIVRLYGFDGKQITPENILVMNYQDRMMPDGQKFKEILGLKRYSSYADAEAFVTSQKQGQYIIIGTDPLVSPVPLEQLAYYKLAYQSEQTTSIGSAQLPAVKIFECESPDS